MSYFPPQVQVTETQQTVSPTLIAPDLGAVNIGAAYNVTPILSNSAASTAIVYSGLSQVVTIPGLDSTQVLDQNSVYVDLVVPLNASSLAGTRIHVSGLVTTSSTVTIPAGVTSNGTPIGFSSAAQIFIGYRALRSDLAEFLAFDGFDSAINEFGYLTSDNPLGFATALSLTNANKTVYAYGTRADGFTGLAATVSGQSITETTEHANAQDTLGQHSETYAFAPLSIAQLGTYYTYVTAQSQPTAKHEMIVFGSPKIPWADATNPQNNKTTTATAVQVANASIANFRVFSVFPDLYYVQEQRHVSTFKNSYIANVYVNAWSTVPGPFAYLAQNVTFSSTNPTTYWAGSTAGVGTKIDDTLWTALNWETTTWYSVFYPVPGCFMGSVNAGQVSLFDTQPQQGLTNMPVAGLAQAKYSTDWFSETYLNTMAAGGTYIMKQPNLASSLSSRHQLSTDMSSVQKRELSITKTVDYVAKFIRNSVSPYIGRYQITPRFLTLLTITIKGLGQSLVNDGVLNGFQLVSLVQDPVDADTVDCVINILPPYPVNYIMVNLVF